MNKIRDALELGLDACAEIATRYHAEMSGYRAAEHARLDANVEAIRSTLAELEAQLPIAWVHRRKRDGFIRGFVLTQPDAVLLAMAESDNDEYCPVYASPKVQDSDDEDGAILVLLEAAGHVTQAKIEEARAIVRALPDRPAASAPVDERNVGMMEELADLLSLSDGRRVELYFGGAGATGQGRAFVIVRGDGRDYYSTCVASGSAETMPEALALARAALGASS